MFDPALYIANHLVTGQAGASATNTGTHLNRKIPEKLTITNKRSRKII